MNTTTKFYQGVQSLLNDANKIMESVNKLQSNDYNTLIQRLIDVMRKTIQLISSLSDVSNLDDDSSSRFIFKTDLDSADFGTLKQYSNALIYAMNKMSSDIVKSINISYAHRYENLAIEYVIDLTDCLDLYCYTHWDKKDTMFAEVFGRRPSMM